MQVFFPATPNPKIIDSAHAAVSLHSLIRGGLLRFSDLMPMDVYVEYDYWKIVPRHARNVVAVDFSHHLEEGVILFHRAYQLNETIVCPYKSRHIRRLTFNAELDRELYYCGPPDVR